MKNRWSLLFAVLLLAATVAVYWPGIRSPFQFDDEGGIVMNPSLWRLSDIGTVLTYKLDLPRPIFNLSLAIDYALWGLSPTGYHLTNLLIHFLCAMLVWRLTNIVLVILGREAVLSRSAGIIAGSVFALHPAASESVIYIWSRSSSLVCLFLLAALAIWLTGIEPLKRARIAFAFVLYLLAIASKEEAVFFPALLVAAELCLFERAGRKRRLIYTLPFWGMPIVLLIVRWALGNGSLDFVSWRAGQGDELAKLAHDRGFAFLFPINFATQSKVGLEYLRMLFWPIGLSVDHGGAFEMSFPSFAAIAGMAMVLGFPALFVFIRRRYPVAAVATAFFILPISIFYVAPVTDMMVERRLYFPLAGFSILAGVCFARAMQRRFRVPLFLFIVMLSSFAFLTHSRAVAWQDRIKLWAEAVRVSPSKLRPRVTLARYYYESGFEDHAIRQNLMALNLRPDCSAAIGNLGLIYLRKGDYAAAEKYFLNAAYIHPRADFNARYNLGVVYEETNRIAEADEQYRLALKINPDLATAQFKRGLIAVNRNDFPAAIDHFRAALQINPEMLEAHLNLGNALVDSGKIEEGLDALKKATDMAPNDPLILYSLGMTYLQIGRIEEAKTTLTRFIRNAGSLPEPEKTKSMDQARKALEELNSR